MRTRNVNLAAALATLAAVLMPLTAGANSVAPNVKGSFFGPATNASILFENDTLPGDMLDIVEIELDLTTALASNSFFMWHGTAMNPGGGGLDGFAVSFTGGEGTSADPQILLEMGPAAGGVPGFNGGEKLELIGVDIRKAILGLPAPSVAELAGTGVKVWFAYGGGAEGTAMLNEPWQGFFVLDPEDANRLILVPVPEPSTSVMLALGLSGLALASRRRS